MRKYLNLRFNIALGLLFAFLVNTLGPFPAAQADDFRLPAPGVMVRLSPEFNPAILKGIKVHLDNPFRFDFILDQGTATSAETQLKQESTRLIKYFLASLTIPEKDLWVNLSPYEKNRIIPQSFGLTEMGRDLLAEDYMLKQITASLIYPEGEVGKKFWKRVYEEAAKKFGTTNIPVNTFNKVWIVPEKAVVYENAKAGTAYIVESKLKVMLEQDYLSLQKHSPALPLALHNDVASVGANIIREIVIPELTKEVNEDQNFAQLRQVYNSLILATWYKKKIKNSILEQVYADKNKVAGVDYKNSTNIEAIYQRYLQAFKKGVYNYIKEEQDPLTQQSIPRKYFSGGWEAGDLAQLVSLQTVHQVDPAQLVTKGVVEINCRMDLAMIGDKKEKKEPVFATNEAMNVEVKAGAEDRAMITEPTLQRLLETSELNKDWVVNENDFTRELRAAGKLNATKADILEDSSGTKDSNVQDQAFRRVIEDFILADDGSVLREVFKVMNNEDIAIEDIENIKAGILFPSSSLSYNSTKIQGFVHIKIVFSLKGGKSTFCVLRANLRNKRSLETVNIAEYGDDKIMAEPSGVINNQPWNFVSRAFRLEDGAIVRYGYVPSIRIFAPEVIKGYNSNMYRSADAYGQTVGRARASFLSRLWKELTGDLGENDSVLDFAVGEGRDLITEGENGEIKELDPEIYKKIIAMDFMSSALEKIRTRYPDIMTMQADWLHIPRPPAGSHVRRIFGLNAISYVPQSQLNAVITQLDQILEPTAKGRKEMTFLVDIQPARNNFYSHQNKPIQAATTEQRIRQEEIFRREWVDALRGAFTSHGYKLQVETKTEIVQGQVQEVHKPFMPSNVFSYGIGKDFQTVHNTSIPNGEVKEQLTVWLVRAIKKDHAMKSYKDIDDKELRRMFSDLIGKLIRRKVVYDEGLVDRLGRIKAKLSASVQNNEINIGFLKAIPIYPLLFQLTNNEGITTELFNDFLTDLCNGIYVIYIAWREKIGSSGHGRILSREELRNSVMTISDDIFGEERKEVKKIAQENRDRLREQNEQFQRERFALQARERKERGERSKAATPSPVTQEVVRPSQRQERIAQHVKDRQEKQLQRAESGNDKAHAGIKVPVQLRVQRKNALPIFIYKDPNYVSKNWKRSRKRIIVKLNDVFSERKIEETMKRAMRGVRSGIYRFKIFTKDGDSQYSIYVKYYDQDEKKRLLVFGFNNQTTFHTEEAFLKSDFDTFLDEFNMKYPTYDDFTAKKPKEGVIEQLQDAAMLEGDRLNKGGIDLTSANMNLQSQNSGGEIKFHMDPAMLQKLQNAPGFVPVIINIQPMNNLREFLGLNDPSTLKSNYVSIH